MSKKIGPYVLGRLLGSGSFGKVYLGRHSETNEVVAVKCFDKARLNKTLLGFLDSEVKTMKVVQSEHVVKLCSAMQTQNTIYLFLEYCEGGDFDQFIKDNRAVFEETAKKWIFQLLSAFTVLRDNRVIHRDVKPANILLTSTDSKSANAKLADFGLAKVLTESLRYSVRGSRLFMAPEMLLGKAYNYKVDVWSLGTFVYQLLTGEVAFDVACQGDLMHKQAEPLDFPVTCSISREGRDFIRQMLTYEPDLRPSFEDLKRHPFMRGYFVPIPEALQGTINEVSSEDKPQIGELINKANETRPTMQHPINEASETRPTMQDPRPLPSLARSLSEAAANSLFDYSSRCFQLDSYLELAADYHNKDELMVAYALYNYYSKQSEQLIALLEGISDQLSESRLLIAANLIEATRGKHARASSQTKALTQQLAHFVEARGSVTVFQQRDTVEINAEELVEEVRRVLGGLDRMPQDEVQRVCVDADSLLQVILDAFPSHASAEALVRDVRNLFEQALET
jgi:serine/threonine-protein kinase ULK/ATG1